MENRMYYYGVEFPDGKRWRHYKYETALEVYEREGVKLYAYTKTFKPFICLLKWKQA